MTRIKILEILAMTLMMNQVMIEMMVRMETAGMKERKRVTVKKEIRVPAVLKVREESRS